MYFYMHTFASISLFLSVCVLILYKILANAISFAGISTGTFTIETVLRTTAKAETRDGVR